MSKSASFPSNFSLEKWVNNDWIISLPEFVDCPVNEDSLGIYSRIDTKFSWSSATDTPADDASEGDFSFSVDGYNWSTRIALESF